MRLGLLLEDLLPLASASPNGIVGTPSVGRCLGRDRLSVLVRQDAGGGVLTSTGSGDGTISAAGKALLEAARAPMEADALARQLNLPLFRVRSALRELAAAKFVDVEDAKYVVMALGARAITQR